MRKRLAPVVALELIEPGEKWELDHRDDGRGWLGPSHAKCNRRAGWERMVDVVSGNGHREHIEESPYKWSQRWFDDPPIGTTVVAGRGLVEVYLGNWNWSDPVPRPAD